MVSPLRIGVIGYSEGNGHPFSFSSIINGYDGARIRRAGWSVIADYLDKQDAADIGIDDAEVVACWADDPAIARDIAQSARIDSIVSPEEMIDRVDAMIVARDDWRTHAPLAMPFLEAGRAVMIDKPLTLDRAELDAFRPYLESGQLMSASALRYARELDDLRAGVKSVGRLQMVSGAVVSDFSRYGIHLLEAAVGVTGKVPTVVSAHRVGDTRHAFLTDQNGVGYALTAMGATHKRFRLSFYGDDGSFEADLLDNFSSFRRMLHRFVDQARDRRPRIPPHQTLALIEALIVVEERLQS